MFKFDKNVIYLIKKVKGKIKVLLSIIIMFSALMEFS